MPKKMESISNKLNAGESVSLLVLDVEVYENDKDKKNPRMLEIGLTYIQDATMRHGETPLSLANNFRWFHVIVEEHDDLRNGKLVADKKYDANYCISEKLGQKDAVQAVGHIIKELVQNDRTTTLIGHSFQGDLARLRGVGLDVVAIGVDVCDIASVNRWWTTTWPLEGLQTLLRRCNIQHTNLHNAVNDAHYTLEVFLHFVKDCVDQSSIIMDPKKIQVSQRCCGKLKPLQTSKHIKILLPEEQDLFKGRFSMKISFFRVANEKMTSSLMTI